MERIPQRFVFEVLGDNVKLYVLVEKLLRSNPELRDSDRLLIWEIWKLQGIVSMGTISMTAFVQKAQLPENIRRTRQKIQEKYPELRSSFSIQTAKKEKQAQKGTFVYREKVPQVGWSNEGNMAMLESMRKVFGKGAYATP